MEGFLNKANEMIEDANLSIKNYNKLIKEYETKGFFGKMFSEDPQAQESKISSKKGVIENINEKKKIKTHIFFSNTLTLDIGVTKSSCFLVQIYHP